MLKLGELHTHTMNDASPESALTYWRVQVAREDGSTETLVLTESELRKARERTAKHPSSVLPAPMVPSTWAQVKRLVQGAVGVG